MVINKNVWTWSLTKTCGRGRLTKTFGRGHYQKRLDVVRVNKNVWSWSDNKNVWSWSLTKAFGRGQPSGIKNVEFQNGLLLVDKPNAGGLQKSQQRFTKWKTFVNRRVINTQCKGDHTQVCEIRIYQDLN